MTAQLAPTPVFKAFSNNGFPLAFGTLTTYAAGTTNLQATYIDSTQTTQNLNPIPLNFRGECALWLDPTLNYKFVLKDSFGNMIPGYPVDNIPGGFGAGQLSINLIPNPTNTFTLGSPTNSWAQLYLGPNDAPVLDPTTGNIGYYARTAAEIAVNVTPVNFVYPPLTVDRYGTNTTPGTTDMTTAIKAAWNVAKQQGFGVITFLKGTLYAISSLDAASPINIPEQQANGSIANQAYPMQLYFQSGSNITIDFQGCQIKSTLTGGPLGMVFDNCQNIRLIGPNFTGTQVQSTGVAALGAITAGSGYVNGTYTNVPLTGGSGTGACATFVVTGGAVTSVTMTYPGGGYAVSDSLGVSNTNLGGSGSGFSIPVSSITGVGNVVSVAGVTPIVCTSISGATTGISISDLSATNCFLAFRAVDNPNNNICGQISLLGKTRVLNGEYGVALHNSGDQTIIENLYTFRVNRPFFFYGVQSVHVNVLADQTNYGFAAVCKAYSRGTRNIAINYKSINAPGQNTARMLFEVQCDPAVVNPPPTVQNVYLDHDEVNVGGGFGIQFDYFAGAGGLVLTASSSNTLFSNIVIRGFTTGSLVSNVTLTTTAQCLTNFDLLQFTRPASNLDLNNQLGFVNSRKFTYSPVLAFGGASTGITYSTQAADYYIEAGICTVVGGITLSSKGSSTGQCTITMPFPTRADSTRNPMGMALGNANMAALGGTLIGYITAAGNTLNLFTQAATGQQSVLDTNFTNTSQLTFQASFPL